MWILLVEDEISLSKSLKRGLEEEGFVVELARNGEEAELLGKSNTYDLSILDWRLPRKDGQAVLKSWRASGVDFPVLMLTALSDTDHKIIGLDSGADDYMSKPFSFEELLARVRALLRRKPQYSNTDDINIGAFHFNRRKRIVTILGRSISLRAKEFLILQLLLSIEDGVFSKHELAERVWGSDTVSDNTIEATISMLRNSLTKAYQSAGIEFHHETYIIETIRGAGYKLNTKVLKNLSQTHE